jgi:hypothetical protein
MQRGVSAFAMADGELVLGRDGMIADQAHHPVRRLMIGGVVAITCAAIATLHSYHRSISLTFCDATLSTDEGAVSLQIPLVKLAANQKFVTSAIVFRRTQMGWEASGGLMKCTLGNWMAQHDEQWFRGWSIADFGYWCGDWQNESRPGPFIVTFVPIWFVFCVAFVAFAVVRRNWLRWSIRSMLILTSVVGVCLWLLTLRENATG